jgi:hypothetical protein
MAKLIAIFLAAVLPLAVFGAASGGPATGGGGTTYVNTNLATTLQQLTNAGRINTGTRTLEITNASFVERTAFRPSYPLEPGNQWTVFSETYDGKASFVVRAPGGTSPDSRAIEGKWLANPWDEWHYANVHFRIPFFAVKVDVARMCGGATDQVMVGMKSGSGTNSIVANYNNATGVTALQWITNGAVQNIRLVTKQLTAPFSLALHVSDQNVSMWYSEAGRAWVFMDKAALNGLVDFRDPAVLADYLPIIRTVATGSTAPNYLFLEGFSGGYGGGISIANPAPLTYLTGEPVIRNNKLFFHANQSSPADSGFNISTSDFCVWTLDLTTFHVECVSKLAFNRGGKLYGENSGSMCYDEARGKWVLLVPNWGDGGAGAVYTYKYETTDDLLSGVHILANGVDIQLPTPTSEYDTSLVKIGTTNWITYSATSTTTGWSSIYPAVAFNTDGSLTNWTLQATNGLHTSDVLEGSKLVKVGGQWRALFGYGNGASTMTFRTYSLGLTDLGVVTALTDFNGSISPHPALCMVPRDGKTTEILFTHDGTPFNNEIYTYGTLHVAEGTGVQTQYENAVKAPVVF